MPTPLNPTAQPFVFTAPSPRSLADLSLEDPPAGSWSRLPAKIKERIVQDVLAIIDEQEAPHGEDSMVSVAVGFFAHKDISDKETMMSIAFKINQLKRLESLNREMRDICSPLSWQALHMGMFDKAALERLEEVLPPHASHVRFVNFGDVTMKPCCGATIKDSDARARDKVASRVFRMCANVEEVALTEPRQQPDGVFPLQHLRVATVATASYGARNFAFLRRQPHLESLFVHSEVPPLGPHSVQLAQSLSRFSHLKHLRVKGTALVTTAFLERAIAIPSPLECIELVSAQAYITFDALAAFLTKFSATLVSVDVNIGDIYSQDLWPVPGGPSLELPRLTTLAVGTAFDAPFFLRLLSPDMPLSFFRLDFFPSLATDASELLDFLVAHAPTLERVYLSGEALGGTDHWDEAHDGAPFSDYVVVSIVEECVALGIKCELGDALSYGSSADESEWYDEDSSGLEAEVLSPQRQMIQLLRVAAQQGPDAFAEAKSALERDGRIVSARQHEEMAAWESWSRSSSSSSS